MKRTRKLTARQERKRDKMHITDERVTELINKHYLPLNDDLAAFRDRCQNNDIPVILKETESFLNSFLTVFKPIHILEIGSAWGYSASYFATLLGDASVHTIEREPEMVSAAKANFKILGLDERIRIFPGDAISVLDVLRYPGCDNSNNKEYDFVFIDAAKSKYREFFDKSLKLCSSGSLIICDNVLLKGSIADSKFDARRRHRTNIKRMNDFIEYVYSMKNIKSSLVSVGDGLLISILG